MEKIKSIIPVFYTRCVNAPYTEGHIQVVRMITKSLLLYNVRSIILNFKYNIRQSAIEDACVSRHRIEQKIPLITRDSLYQFSAPIAAYAVSMEALKTLRFFLLTKLPFIYPDFYADCSIARPCSCYSVIHIGLKSMKRNTTHLLCFFTGHF